MPETPALRVSDERLAWLVREMGGLPEPHDPFDDELLVCLRELQALRREREWRPIETAPADWTPVWIYGGQYEVAAIVEADGEYWRWCIANGLRRMPTHWMPAKLPEPPHA